MRHALFVTLLAAIPAHAAPPLIVEARYPGANPQTVADAVLAPLELQIQGIDGVHSVRCLSTTGRCLVRLDLKPGVDRNKVRTELANRIALANPQLPESARLNGVQIRRDMDLDDGFWLCVLRSDGQADAMVLAAVAKRIRDSLVTIPQVADVAIIGAPERIVRIQVDVDRIAARALEPSDVLAALRLAHVDKPERFAANADELSDLLVATRADSAIRLRDIAVIEMGVERNSIAGTTIKGALHNVFLLVRTHTGAGVEFDKQIEGLKLRLPPGVILDCQRCLPTDTAVTIRLPESASLERREQLAREAATALARAASVREVAWLTTTDDRISHFVVGPLNDGGRAELRMILARLPVGGRIEKLRIPFENWPGEGAALVARISGDDAAAARTTAEHFRDRLAKLSGVVDVLAEPAESNQININIDRKKAAKLQVSLAAINDAIELAQTGVRIGPVVVTTPGGERGAAADLRTIRVRNGKGDWVPLGTLVEIQGVRGASAVCRDGGRPCFVVSWNVQGKDMAVIRKESQALIREFSRPGIAISIE